MFNNRYIKIFIIFIGVAVALTVVSRAADSVTVARVNAEEVKRGSLVQKTTVSGEIDASKKHYLTGTTLLRVEEINVGAGSAVEAGDVLFTLDYNYLKDQADKVKTELSNLNLEMQKLRLDSGGSNSSVRSAQEELDRALADDEFNRSLNDGVQMLTDKRKIDDAQSKLEDAKKTASDSADKNSIDISIKDNSRQAKQKEYDEIAAILKNGGKVSADMKGTIGEIFVTQGEIMKSENYCTIIPDGANFVFTGEISVDDAQYMKTGDAVNITLSGKSRGLSNLKIKSISREDTAAKIIVDLPDGTDAYPGQKATLSHEQKSEEYRNLVPLGAIRGSDGDYYVYIVADEKGVLGVQKTATRVDVTVVEKDNKNAAIDGGVSSSDLVISKSNKTVAEGDRVRVQSADI